MAEGNTDKSTNTCFRILAVIEDKPNFLSRGHSDRAGDDFLLAQWNTNGDGLLPRMTNQLPETISRCEYQARESPEAVHELSGPQFLHRSSPLYGTPGPCFCFEKNEMDYVKTAPDDGALLIDAVLLKCKLRFSFQPRRVLTYMEGTKVHVFVDMSEELCKTLHSPLTFWPLRRKESYKITYEGLLLQWETLEDAISVAYMLVTPSKEEDASLFTWPHLHRRLFRLL